MKTKSATRKNLLKAGHKMASGWGGECYDIRVEAEKNRVVFFCIEHGGKFVMVEKMDYLTETYGLTF